MTLAIGWLHEAGDQPHPALRGGSMTLAISWLHEGGETLGTWLHEAGDWQLLLEALLPQLRAACAAIERFDVEIARLCPELPDYELFRALPGAGPALAPRLLVAFGERRERFPNAAALHKYAGVAPVTERSGNKSWVHWRYSCPKFLRQSFIEWVAQTIPRSFWAQAFYKSCRSRGMRHQAALRALAFKWIRILHRCWVERKPYDESRYLLALQKRQAPLLKFAAANPD